jgi:sugar-specific transcriptional regulator TrmB
MAVSQDRIQKMKSFGLTEYQARAYLALLDLGSATGSQIPASSRVPRTRVYETMQQLHEKGLVQIIPEKPVRYKAVAFSSYLRTLAEEHRLKAQQLTLSAASLAREFAPTATKSAEERGRFEALYGRRNVRDRLLEMYDRAETHVTAIGSVHSPARILHGLGLQLEERAAVGVRLKFAFFTDQNNEPDVRSLARYSDVRHIDFFTPVERHAIDGREYLMSHPIPDDDSPTRGEDIAIWTDDPAIASAMDQSAERIWEMGMRVAPRGRAVAEAERPRRLTPLAGP